MKKENIYIKECGQLVPIPQLKKYIFCGFYAAVGCNGSNAGDLFAVLSGPILAPAFNASGKRLNVGSDKAGKSYSEKLNTWYNE